MVESHKIVPTYDCMCVQSLSCDWWSQDFHSVSQSDPNTHVGTEENSQSVKLLDLSFTGYIITTTSYFLSFKKLSYKDQNTWSSANPMKLFS